MRALEISLHRGRGLGLVLGLAWSLSAAGAVAQERSIEELRQGEVGGPGAAPRSTNPFNLFLRTTLRGGLAAGATCITFADVGAPTGGVIELTGVPAGATVQGAWLYWSTLGEISPMPSGAPSFDGTPMVPVSLGTVEETPCLPQRYTGTFRADVTALVSGDGTYPITDFLSDGDIFGTFTEGATLFVVYCHPSSPPTDIVIYDGVDVTYATSRIFFHDLTGFAADLTGPVTAFLGVAAGNGQVQWSGPDFTDVDPFFFNGTDLDALMTEILGGRACSGIQSYYDLTFLDVSTWVAPGATSATIESVAVEDCLTFAAVAFAVSTDPATVVPDCLDAACFGVVSVEPSYRSCGGEPVVVSLDAMFPGCPPGPTERASQIQDPIQASNGMASSELAPDIAALSASAATLTFLLGGDTDLTDCVEVLLMGPSGATTIVKAAGAAHANPYDVGAAFEGPGTYSLIITESVGCGASAATFGLLGGAVLVVEADTGGPAVELQVERADGTVLCDWSELTECLVTPDCPGETLVARARCVFDVACEASMEFDIQCSELVPAFGVTAPCGSTELCFEDQTVSDDPIGSWAWDFNGDAGPDEAMPCFDFVASGPPPWPVTLTVTDAAGCEGTTMQSVSPVAAPPALEVSAIDVDSLLEPLRVVRDGLDLRLTWEDNGGEGYHLYRGALGDFTAHADFGECWLSAMGTTISEDDQSHYYLVLGTNCAGEESSLGRGSLGVERPAASPGCP